jgi:hypothetical protein
MSEWKRKHPDAELPISSEERREFKALLKSWQRKIDDCPIPEENFDEAVSNMNKVWGPKKIRTSCTVCDSCIGEMVY